MTNEDFFFYEYFFCLCLLVYLLFYFFCFYAVIILMSFRVRTAAGERASEVCLVRLGCSVAGFGRKVHVRGCGKGGGGAARV